MALKNLDKMSEDQRTEAIEKYKTGKYNCAKLGREYGVSGQFINRLLRKTGQLAEGYINTTRRLSIGGSHQVKKFLNWIYKDSTIHMDRKYKKYLDIIAYTAKGRYQPLIHEDGSPYTTEEKKIRWSELAKIRKLKKKQNSN